MLGHQGAGIPSRRCRTCSGSGAEAVQRQVLHLDPCLIRFRASLPTRQDTRFESTCPMSSIVTIAPSQCCSPGERWLPGGTKVKRLTENLGAWRPYNRWSKPVVPDRWGADSIHRGGVVASTGLIRLSGNDISSVGVGPCSDWC